MSQTIWPILRSILAVIVGYLILAFTNMAFVTLFFVKPILDAGPMLTIVLNVPYTFVLSLIGGYVTAWVAMRSEVKHAAILAVIMAAVTVISMIIAVAVEPLWYKITYLIVMVPATILGGHVRDRRRNK